jgi:hypothetical protein
MSTEILVKVIPSPECPSGEIRIIPHAAAEEGEFDLDDAFDEQGAIVFKSLSDVDGKEGVS